MSTEKTIGEIVQKKESDFLNGTTQVSKYVSFSMHDTLETIEAYINSTHVSGKTDSLGREKPFFNIVTSAINIWFRATDIDRKDIKIRANKSKDWIDSFLATVLLRDWMRRSNFGTFLNEWGRSLARYGSTVIKFVENSEGLHIQVIPWNRLIVDAVDFDANPKIEVLELTIAQLRERIETHGYDKEQVKNLEDTKRDRETLDKKKKDNLSDYIKVYELHGNLPLCHITDKESDEDIYVQQMHVVCFLAKKEGRKTEYDEFTLYKGREAQDPYMITHLIKEDGKTLSIGAVQHLFEAQWMVNHSQKAVKDQLDLASKLVFQSSDPRFVGKNVLTDIETGDIFTHNPNEPLTQVNNQSHDLVSWQNFAVNWKSLGNEITGVSEAMFGGNPPSGTAWRQTEALLQESYSLFELMTENKGLQIEQMLRERIIPALKKKLDTSEEVTAVLEQYDIDRIDRMYIKNQTNQKVNDELINQYLNDEIPTQETQAVLTAQTEQQITESLQQQGNQRFFKPSDVDDKTWKEQFKDLEWNVEVDITGEAQNSKDALATLNTALATIVQPGFEQNKKAQMIVGRILELTGAMSPVEYNAIPATPMQPPQPTAQPV